MDIRPSAKAHNPLTRILLFVAAIIITVLFLMAMPAVHSSIFEFLEKLLFGPTDTCPATAFCAPSVRQVFLFIALVIFYVCVIHLALTAIARVLNIGLKKTADKPQ